MKPSPLSYLNIPSDWPKVGYARDGRAIDLKTAWETSSYAALASLTVDVPGKGRIRPWADSEWLDTFELVPGAEGLMTREELESNGIVDDTLVAWARDAHGIALDLSSDDVDTQYIRADAWKRFVAETW